MNVYGLLIAGCVTTGCFAQGKFELQPFAGIRFGGNLRNGDNDPASINLPASAAVGASLAYHFVPDFGLEFMYTTQKASSLRINQYLGNVIFNVVDKEEAATARYYPFLLAGFGAVQTSGSGMSDTRYSYTLGGGMKYFFNKHFGLRLQGRYIIVHLYTTPNLGPPVCEPGIYSPKPFCTTTNNYESRQGDVTLGFVFRF